MIIVTGATGNVGRPLIQFLTDAGHTVTALARGTSAPLAAGPRVVPVTADLTKPGTLAPVLAGAEALFLIVPVHIDAPALLRAAADADVRRVVLLSSQAAGTRPDSLSHAPLAAVEDTLRESGLGWTILRPGGFTTNALAWAPAVRAQRTVFAPYGDVALPAIDPDDIAAVAAAALTSDGHERQTYVLTGPEATSPRRRTEILSAVLGLPLTFTELPPEEARTRLLQLMPAPVADGTLAILGRPTPEEVQVSPDAEQVLGRPAHSFADWAGRNADAFRPSTDR